jgi:hypothetical protein
MKDKKQEVGPIEFIGEQPSRRFKHICKIIINMPLYSFSEWDWKLKEHEVKKKVRPSFIQWDNQNIGNVIKRHRMTNAKRLLRGTGEWRCRELEVLLKVKNRKDPKLVSLPVDY